MPALHFMIRCARLLICEDFVAIQGGLTHKKLLIRNRGAGNGVEEASFLFFLREKHTTEKRKEKVCSVL
jgi:hypothetical protein